MPACAGSRHPGYMLRGWAGGRLKKWLSSQAFPEHHLLAFPSVWLPASPILVAEELLFSCNPATVTCNGMVIGFCSFHGF